MCGIVGVLSRSEVRDAPDLAAVQAALDRATKGARDWRPSEPQPGGLRAAVEAAEAAARDLRGFAGLRALLEAPLTVADAVSEVSGATAELEDRLDAAAARLPSARLETLQALLIRLKDAVFALSRDRIANLERVRALAPEAASEAHWHVGYDLNVAFNALDRLEVRGRDSAGIHLLVSGDLEDLGAELESRLAEREQVPDFAHLAVRRTADAEGRPVLGFVYKVAAEVGDLGDNVRTLRAAVAEDTLLQAVLARPGVRADVLAHTRWASVGVVSEVNAHPQSQESADGDDDGPYVVAALNGDVDNYAQLLRDEGLRAPRAVTTDAKVIPMLVSALLGRGEGDAFRRAVSRMDGSIAVAGQQAAEPGRMQLALRGSGQALYVGLADGAFIVASEPYGVVEEAATYLRLDGETLADRQRPESRGQIVILDREQAGDVAGMERLAFDGTPLPVEEADLTAAGVTTRDIDRGAHRHYLRKEIDEAPGSFRKTLRGRLVVDGDQFEVRLGEESLPGALRARLAGGEIRSVRVIGQGTAAVAGQGVAAFMHSALMEAGIRVQAQPASEVSGFHLRPDMSDELVVAISQSGTTTDTNRTVDLLRARGAAVVAIVNRRGSDLTERAEGVLYTSDGRDVEMSVASTKAFYSQIAAGALLAEALADACGVGASDRGQRVLRSLHALPGHMQSVLASEQTIEEAAHATAPYRRHWALVGNGRNRVAAEEIRIKLSELCYKAIPCDATEDKKHIDLSSEPLILVCAAGLERGNAIDAGKEVEIFAAHQACPVVVATEDDGHAWKGAAALLRVPDAGPDLTFVLSTMVGHLFGYHAALAIDGLARPLREARAGVDVVLAGAVGDDVREHLRDQLRGSLSRYREDLAEGRYDGTLDARSATRLQLALRYATGTMPLELFSEDFGRPGTPASAVDELVGALTDGIEALTRPVDAIKHQAKTVTVGISRGEEDLLAVPLVRAVLETGTEAAAIGYPDLKALQALDPAITSVEGATRYAIDHDGDVPTIRVVGRSGISEGMPSRVDRDAELKGTKNSVALERRLIVAVGRSDGRPIVLVPEQTGGECTGIVLLHTSFADDLDASTKRAVLSGYKNRFALIRDAVVEAGGEFRDEMLDRVSILDLLAKPVLVIADRMLESAER